MARRKREFIESDPPNPLAWMVTFSDLVTLLLTFFVLIICVTTLDPKIFLENAGSNVQEGGVGVLKHGGGKALNSLEQLLENLDVIPDQAPVNQDELRKALFQLDPDAPDSSANQDIMSLAAKVRVNIDDRGLVLKWDGDIIFPEGRSVIQDEQQALLTRLAAVLKNTSLPISIEAHTDPDSSLEGGDGAAAYQLAFARSRAVMDFFIGQGIEADRFRLGGYGPSRPLAANGAPVTGPAARRLEIVLYKAR